MFEKVKRFWRAATRRRFESNAEMLETAWARIQIAGSITVINVVFILINLALFLKKIALR